MSGKRHHTIPRFLMKGFASRIDGDSVYTYVYRKNAQIFEANTLNVNVEAHFYGKKDEEYFADDVITDLEKDKFSPLLNTLRNSGGIVGDSSSEIAGLFSNLILRTKNFRNSFHNLSGNICERFDAYLSNSKNLEKILLNQPKFLENELEEKWRQLIKPLIDANPESLPQQVQSLSEDEMKKVFFENTKKEFPQLIKNETPEFSEQISEMFSGIRNELPKIIKDMHNKQLLTKCTSENRIKDYLQLNWFVITVETPVILGDVGCIFETVGKRRFKGFDDSYESLINAFLPISAHKVLVGSKYKTIQNLDIKTLNQAIASCSIELFISSEKSLNEKLHKSIGNWATLLTDKETDFYIGQLFDDIESLDSLMKRKKDDN